MFKSKVASAATDTHAHRVTVDATVFDDLIVLLDASVKDRVQTAVSFGRVRFVLETLKEIRARDRQKTYSFIGDNAPSDPTSIKITLAPRPGRSLSEIELELTAARVEMGALHAQPRSRRMKTEAKLRALKLERAFAIYYARSNPEVLAEARIAKRDARNGGTDIRYTMADGSMFEGAPRDIATLMRDLGRDGTDAN
jgi:hypothetical protein